MIFYAWAWIPALILFSILILFFLEDSRETGATFSFIAGAVIVNYMFHWQAVYWIRDHVGKFALFILAYFAIGIVWSFVKWYFFLLNIRDEVKEAGTVEEWKRKSGPNWERRAFKVPPDPSEHKDRIMGWMTYWPWSAVWTLINDPIRRLWRSIYSRLAGSFKSVSDRVFRDV